MTVLPQAPELPTAPHPTPQPGTDEAQAQAHLTPPETPPSPAQAQATRSDKAPNRATRYQTQLYLTVRPKQQLASAVVVRGGTGLIYDINLGSDTPADEALSALVKQCRVGDNIQLYSTQAELIEAARKPSPALRRALAAGNRSLTLKRGGRTLRNTIWQDILHLQTTGQLDRGILPNQFHLYVSAITDGRSTYCGAVLHGPGQLMIHNRTLGTQDLVAGELKAVEWAMPFLPPATRLELHVGNPATGRVFMQYPTLLAQHDAHASGHSMTAITRVVNDQRIIPIVHVPTQGTQSTPRDLALARHARMSAAALLTQ